MSTQPLVIVILAAGKGTRMKSETPKVMHTLAGKPMISWLLETCESLNPQKIITVIGPDMPELRKTVAPHETVIQENRNGTGGALKCALPALKDFKGKLLVLMGDEPLVGLKTLQQLAAAQTLAVQAFQTQTPHGLGRIILKESGTLKTIIEEADCTNDQKTITLCNAGNYCIPSENLQNWLDQIDENNAQSEIYLTDLPVIAAKDGVETTVISSHWMGPWGVNDRIQLAVHEKMAQTILREKALLNGVAMIDPNTVYFYYDTQIAQGTTIEPNVFFGPNVEIADNVTIKAFSHIEGATIKSGATIGPFARIRPETEIAEDVRIGNFVEIKKSTIGKGSKINHHGYVGDTQMGADVNFSCGAITVNYDGFEKHKTIIGDNVMVGSKVSLVAPITIGDDAFLAAGSTLTGDVESNALAMTRPDAEVKKGWAAKYRKIKSAAKKTALVIVMLVASTSVSMACEGFKTSMGALEKTLLAHHKNQAQKQSTMPHLNSLNKDLDELEKRVAEYHAKKAAQAKSQKPQSQKP
ncbi:MAG: bifunctional UDP-N-acetylglucosamine diphosphorylase/glucosamine-1-phosphate N-acetyltransferase GlmU [Bdellovibrionales bacterium]